MGQIVIPSKTNRKRCNLKAIQNGGSLVNTVLNNGEYMLVDSTDTKTGASDEGFGVYDSYIVGDGTTPCGNLPINNIDDKNYDSASFSGLGKKILWKNIVNVNGTNKNLLVSSHFPMSNTVYVVIYDYDMNGQTITLPPNCALEFDGGSITNGYLNLNNAELRGDVNITAEPAWDETNEFWEDYKPSNLALNVSWFGAKADGVSDDAPAIKRCIKWLHKNGATMVFDLKGTYILGDGVKDLVNDPNMILHTGYGYDPTSAVLTGDWSGVGDRAAYIAAHPANIGRDISLLFFRFTNLTIEGNGATIKSHDNNGYCRHNELFKFLGCDYLKLRDITIDANRENRPETWACFGDYGFGSVVETYSMLMLDSFYDAAQLNNTWSGGVGTRDVSAGYRDVGNLTLKYCNFATIENVISNGSLLDGLNFNGFVNYFPHDLIVRKSTFEHSSRHNFTTGGASACLLEDCCFQFAGLKDDEETELWYSTSSNIDLEGENGAITNVVVRNSTFRKTGKNTFVITTDTRYCLVDGCRFENSGINPTSGSGAFMNEVKNCTFINCGCNFYQEGINVHHNKFQFNDYTGVIMDYRSFTYDDEYVYGRITENKASIVPSRFCNNIIECTWSEQKTVSQPLIRVEGNYIINDNVFINPHSDNGFGVVFGYCKEFKGNRVFRDTDTYSWLAGTVICNPWKSLKTEIDIENNDASSTANYGYQSRLRGNGCLEYNITNSFVNQELWLALDGLRANVDIILSDGKSARASFVKTGKGGWDGVIGSVENPTESISCTGYYSTMGPAYVKVVSVSIVNIHVVIYGVKKTSIDNGIILSTAPTITSYRTFEDANRVVAALPTFGKYSESHAVVSTNLRKMCVRKAGDNFYTSDGWPATYATRGTTVQRPTPAADMVGFEYYDTTLNKIVWWNGSEWLSAAEAPANSSFKILPISQADYDNLQTYDNNTLYVITSV